MEKGSDNFGTKGRKYSPHFSVRMATFYWCATPIRAVCPFECEFCAYITRRIARRLRRLPTTRLIAPDGFLHILDQCTCPVCFNMRRVLHIQEMGANCQCELCVELRNG